MSKAHFPAGPACGGAVHIAFGFEPTNDTQVSFTKRLSPLHPPKATKATLSRRCTVCIGTHQMLDEP